MSTNAPYQTIEYRVQEDGVALLVFNRPDTLNSFNLQMHHEVKEAMVRVREDPAARCLLLTGKGRGFCAGQDLNERSVDPKQGPPDLGDSLDRYYIPLIRAIVALEQPVVCAVNGVAAGVGSSIALACDIVLAARSASFIQAFIKLGLVPDSGGSWHLPRAVGLPRAKGLALLGDKLPAEQAAAWGLIWECTEDDQLFDRALLLARRLAQLPARGLALTKQLLNTSSAQPLHERLEQEKEIMRRLGKTRDYQEGVAAFLEKRAPRFSARTVTEPAATSIQETEK